MEKEKNVEINTIPRLFWDSVKSRGERVAMREKDLGIWQEISWSHYGEKAKLTGLALHTLGLEKGNVVSIASEGNPEWLYTDMGTIGAGGISSGVYKLQAKETPSGFIPIWVRLVREEFLVECIQQTRLHRLSI